MPPPQFEPAVLASKQPQTHALDRAATSIGTTKLLIKKLYIPSTRCICAFCVVVGGEKKQSLLLLTELSDFYNPRRTVFTVRYERNVEMKFKLMEAFKGSSQINTKSNHPMARTNSVLKII